MKLSSTTKPMSSPSRTDKFPPPLMRFLGSKSRGKSTRASPLFMRKKTHSSSSSKTKTSAIGAIEITQEPSSPKVTCIGQVRVRRSKPKSGNNDRRKSIAGDRESSTNGNGCYCVGKSMFCDSIHVKLRRPSWRDWMFCFSRRRRNVKVRTDSSKTDSGGVDRFCGINYGEYEEEEVVEYSGNGGFEDVSAPSTPPKNALLLTRCRSAPYRSSSLAGQFWGSPPLKTEDEKQEQEEDNTGTGRDDETSTALETEPITSRDETAPALETEPISRDSTAESRDDRGSEEEEKILGLSEEEEREDGSGGREKLEESQDLAKVNVSELRKKFENNNNTNGVEMNSSSVELRRKSGDLVKLRTGIGRDNDIDISSSMKSLIMLKRCKSEPARRGLEMFNPETSNVSFCKPGWD